MNRFLHSLNRLIRGGSRSLQRFAGTLGRLLLAKQLILSVLFSVALLVICLAPFFFVKSYQSSAQDPKGKLSENIIFSSTGKHWGVWQTSDAIKFSLDQVVTTIRYLFAAAAAGMAFIGKIVIEPRISSTSRPLPPFAQYALIVAVLFWIGSITSGMSAHLYLNSVGTLGSFSLSGPVGDYVLFQLLYFALALWLFLIALVSSV